MFGSAIGGARERRFVVTFGSLAGRLGVPIIALSLAFAPPFAAVHAAESARKVAVVSFGLYGDQGVFRSEATGAAQVVASRFGGGPGVVRFNTKTGGNATIETLATTLQAEKKDERRERHSVCHPHVARLARRPRRHRRAAAD
jgi:hypothetical protein